MLRRRLRRADDQVAGGAASAREGEGPRPPDAGPLEGSTATAELGDPGLEVGPGADPSPQTVNRSPLFVEPHRLDPALTGEGWQSGDGQIQDLALPPVVDHHHRERLQRGQ